MQRMVDIVEGLLHLSGDEGMTIQQLMSVTEFDLVDIKISLDKLKEKYNEESPLILVDYGERYHFITNEYLFEYALKLLNLNKVRQLSQSALETLAIIAFKQPITRIEIEEIRGISSDLMLRKLMAQDLIEEAGRLDTPGRPILYRVTHVFLDLFKLVSLEELPQLEKLSPQQEQEFFQ